MAIVYEATNKLVGFDVETRGIDVGYALQPFRARTGEAWLTSAAIASDKMTVGRLNPSTEWLRKWLREMARTETTIIGWNTPFDAAWLIALGLREEVFECKWLDAMLLWRHLTASPEWSRDSVKSYSLKAAVRTYLPQYANYEKDIEFDTDDPVGLQQLLEYNKLDAKLTLKLAQFYVSVLDERQVANALIEAECLPLVAEAHVEGLVANREAAEVLTKKLEDAANLAYVTLRFQPGAESVERDALNSTVKLRKLLYGDWGLMPNKLTEKGQLSTDRDVLSQLAMTDPRAKLLNDYREAKNLRTKFAEGVKLSLDYNGDGRVRPNARVFATYTGRMTYSSKILKGKNERPTGFAIHQMKRDPEFRDLIEAPEGYTLLEFDFAGQEFRWMAVLSRDTTMLSLCQTGEDAHAYMGAKIGGKDYNMMRKLLHDPLDERYAYFKKLRQLGKVANLSLQYRTSPNTLMRVARVSYNLTMSPMEAKAIHATYRTTYPGVGRYWDMQVVRAKSEGFVETKAGRRVWTGKVDTWTRITDVTPHPATGQPVEKYEDYKWDAESTAINFPVQGSGADQKYLALKVLRDYLPRVDGRFYFELHDGIFIVVPDQYAETAARDVKHLLSNLPYDSAWGVKLPIDFPVDAKLGKTWGQLREWQEC
jgi:DNA polymerase-1